MKRLKNNWAIRTSNENFKAYCGTLEALGYPIHTYTKQASTMDRTHLGLCRHWAHQEVQRSDTSNYDSSGNGFNFFDNIEEFIKFHFAEKAPAEKELDKLNKQLVELQAQIEVVKQSVKSN